MVKNNWEFCKKMRNAKTDGNERENNRNTKRCPGERMEDVSENVLAERDVIRNGKGKNVTNECDSGWIQHKDYGCRSAGQNKSPLNPAAFKKTGRR